MGSEARPLVGARRNTGKVHIIEVKKKWALVVVPLRAKVTRYKLFDGADSGSIIQFLR